MLRSGIMGWLFGVVVLIAIVIVPVTVGWWLVRCLAMALATVFGSRRSAAGRGAEFDRVLPPFRADRCSLGLAAGRRADALRVRPRCRHSAGRGQRAARAVRAGRAGGRGLLSCPLRPACVGRFGRADRRAGFGGTDGGRETSTESSRHGDCAVANTRLVRPPGRAPSRAPAPVGVTSGPV